MNISKKVIEILQEISGNELILETDTLLTDLALDSFSMITLLIEIEDQFGIELNESDMNPYDLVTVRNVIDLVDKYLGDEDE